MFVNNPDTTVPEAWSLAMARFYSALQEEMSGLRLVCSGCGQCCHFEQVDHVLFASRMERLYLLAVVVPPAQPDADPESLVAGKRCPFQVDGKCHAREARPLGCRLYFCSDWPDGVDEFAFSERWHGRLKRIHEQLGVEWEYGPLLPLTR